jgi:MerR family transcriptional regulator, light-induced transcriptional regulator
MSTYAEPHDTSVAGAGLSIKEAGEFLGVPAPTLRSWERRYGLPTTPRSVGGHRRYRKAELVQLGLMRDEIAIGRRAADAARWVRGLLDEQNPGAARVRSLLDASNRLDPDAIRSVLELGQAEIGLPATLDEVVMPAMRQIGAWWEAGDCDIDQESLTTAVVRAWLAKVTTLAPPPPAGQPTVLLATGPDDFHTLGLEALAALLAQHGLSSRLLGARTPLPTLLAATAATPGCVVVVVSHLPSQRRSAIASIEAVAESGAPTYFAGNAFLFPASRKGMPGTYLGESIGQAALVIAGSGPGR